MDQFGRIYESDPNRADGGGFGKHATPVTQGDVTLGSAYLKSQAAQHTEAIKEQKIRHLEDQQARQKLRSERDELARIKIKAANEAELASNRQYQQNLQRKALSMGCDCNQARPLTGNVMTANGQFGYAGMNRSQKTIHERTMGAPVVSAFQVDPIEAEQARMKQQANAYINAEARKQLQRQLFEQSQSKHEKAVRDQRAKATHPLMNVRKY